MNINGNLESSDFLATLDFHPRLNIFFFLIQSVSFSVFRFNIFFFSVSLTLLMYLRLSIYLSVCELLAARFSMKYFSELLVKIEG